MKILKSKIVVPSHQKELIHGLVNNIGNETAKSIVEHIIDNGILLHHLSHMSDEKVLEVIKMHRENEQYMQMTKLLVGWWEDGLKPENKEKYLREKYGR